MNDDADIFPILGILALGLTLAVVALVGLPGGGSTLGLLALVLVPPGVAVVAAIAIGRHRERRSGGPAEEPKASSAEHRSERTTCR